MGALVDQSLVQRLPEAETGPRFAMLETVREFGLEQLTTHGEAEEAHRRLLDWCRSLAERAGPRLFTAEEATWLGRLQQEDGNLRAALRWALDAGRASDLETGLRLAAALTDHWYLIGHLSEGSEWLRRAIAVSATGPATIGRARVLVGAALIEQARAAAESARRHSEQGLSLARRLGDQPTQARALTLLANAALLRAEFDRARPRYEEALTLFRQLDDRPWVAVVLVNLGVVAHLNGDLAQAAAHADQALTISRRIGDEWDAAIALSLLGDVARERGDDRAAAEHLSESLALSRRRGTCQQVANAVSAFGSLAVATGSFVRAARLFGAAERLFRSCGIETPPPSRRDWATAVARISAGLSADDFAAAWTAGRALTAEEAIAEALAGAEPLRSAGLDEGPHREEATETEPLVQPDRGAGRVRDSEDEAAARRAGVDDHAA
jgi:non-specific serine/threonine protein kinase